MEGAALKAERDYDLMVAQAWHTAKFSVMAENGKLRGLSTYLRKKVESAKSTTAKAIAFFHQMKARGFPIEITRTPAKDRSARKPDELPPLPQSRQQG